MILSNIPSREARLRLDWIPKDMREAVEFMFRVQFHLFEGSEAFDLLSKLIYMEVRQQ